MLNDGKVFRPVFTTLMEVLRHCFEVEVRVGFGFGFWCDGQGSGNEPGLPHKTHGNTMMKELRN